MDNMLDPYLFEPIPKHIVTKTKVHKIPFKLTGHAAFTFRNHIFTTRPDDNRLLMHELVHVKQYSEYGTFTFLRKYFTEYRANRKAGKSKNDSYRNISFEINARAVTKKWASENS